MKQERAEEKDLNDSYLVRYVKTRPESESFMKQERVEGQDLNDSYPGKVCQD